MNNLATYSTTSKKPIQTTGVCGIINKVTYSETKIAGHNAMGVCGSKHKTTYSVEIIRAIFLKNKL